MHYSNMDRNIYIYLHPFVKMVMSVFTHCSVDKYIVNTKINFNFKGIYVAYSLATPLHNETYQISTNYGNKMNSTNKAKSVEKLICAS